MVSSHWLKPYPHPVTATQELVSDASRFPELVQVETIGASSLGRELFAFHCSGGSGRRSGARLLVTAQIHACEYIAGYVARALVRALLKEYGRDPNVSNLLQHAAVTVVPLLNPDGADFVWQRRGWVGLKGARVTMNGVDPNRNFPFVPISGRRAWNSSSTRPWSPYYRGPHPLSEPECLAVAQLCKRKRFCAALHFHSFGGVTFFPASPDPRSARVFDVFHNVFPRAQRHCRYRPVPEPVSALSGQLDLFLLHAFGTPSATVEVSRPSLALGKRPERWFHFFSWANPPDPERWVENDVPATIRVLEALLERTGGQPLPPEHPDLAEQVPEQSTLHPFAGCS